MSNVLPKPVDVREREYMTDYQLLQEAIALQEIDAAKQLWNVEHRISFMIDAEGADYPDQYALVDRYGKVLKSAAQRVIGNLQIIGYKVTDIYEEDGRLYATVDWGKGEEE